ncbi:MAG: ABC transporter permease [Alphaproteobacteria bacterium]|nr:ABC transporter permease [Alphaproteobacteria bacterium]
MSAPAPKAGAERPGGESHLLQFAREYCEDPIAAVAFLTAIAAIAVALLAPWIAPTDPYDLAKLSILDGRLRPGEKMMNGVTAWLGTDGVGRDMLSAIVYGMRLSIMVAITSAVVAQMLGICVGLAAAYFGGLVDTVIMRLVDMKLGFPSILIALILIAVLGPGIDKLVIALIVAQWAIYTRIMRATALAEKEREYIGAARGLGFGALRVVFKHLLPNCLPPMIVVGTVQVAHAVSIEATLSFLGLGLPPTEPSLGLLIANGFEYLLSGTYWISLYPGFALLFTIMSINLVGDRVRDVLNPRLRR